MQPAEGDSVARDGLAEPAFVPTLKRWRRRSINGTRMSLWTLLSFGSSE